MEGAGGKVKSGVVGGPVTYKSNIEGRTYHDINFIIYGSMSGDQPSQSAKFRTIPLLLSSGKTAERTFLIVYTQIHTHIYITIYTGSAK
jgi:hypothetical protein